jgi:hypothetical protein
MKKCKLKVAFYNNRPSLIVIVSKLVENFTKYNSKYIIKCLILSLKNKKLFGLRARFLCKRLQLISIKHIKWNSANLETITITICVVLVDYYKIPQLNKDQVILKPVTRKKSRNFCHKIM